MIDSVEFKVSNRKGKKMIAVFYNDNKVVKTTHFGQKGSITYVEGASVQKRNNYIKRHSINEDWRWFDRPGTLSAYILWNSPDIDKNIEIYKKEFKFT